MRKEPLYPHIPKTSQKIIYPKITKEHLRWYTEPGGALLADAIANVRGKEQVIEVYQDVETGEWKWTVAERQRMYTFSGISSSKQEAINTAAETWYYGGTKH
jgi:hypothetical protein